MFPSEASVDTGWFPWRRRELLDPTEVGPREGASRLCGACGLVGPPALGRGRDSAPATLGSNSRNCVYRPDRSCRLLYTHVPFSTAGNLSSQGTRHSVKLVTYIFTDVMKVEKHVKEEMVLKLMIEAKVMREETVVKEAEEEKLDVVEMVVKKFVKL
ncbi:hypothetical protein AGIG_G16513 [Arapaima gigas]